MSAKPETADEVLEDLHMQLCHAERFASDLTTEAVNRAWFGAEVLRLREEIAKITGEQQ